MDVVDIRSFRRDLRAQKIAERLAMPAAAHHAKSEVIRAALEKILDQIQGEILAFTWPMRGEVDVRAPVERWLAQDTRRRAALPVVVAAGRPLRFREWTPGCALERQNLGVQIPAAGEWLKPDTLLIPLVGFDLDLFRLGYGGGFYDRTLAQPGFEPFALGMGFEAGRCPTLHPQRWDRPLDAILTEEGWHGPPLGA